MQDLRNAGLYDGKPSVLVIINKQPGANVIETVDRIKDLLVQLRASVPSAITVSIASDQTGTIRASLKEVGRTLMISAILVILVVFLFLRNIRSALIPTVAVSVSLIGTFSLMYLAGFSLDNLSLMALTIATGFVVDDAIVVLENISRHIEQKIPPFQGGTHRGARGGVYGALDEHLAGRGFHPHPAHGRRHRPAFPGVRGHPLGGDRGLAGRFPHDHADDVRAPAQEWKWIRNTAGCIGPANRCSRPCLPLYERTLGWALRHAPFMMLLLLVNRMYECLPVCDRSEGIFPAAGHGAIHRHHPGRSEYLVPIHAAETDRHPEYRPAGSGRRPRCRIYGGRPDQLRLHVRVPETDWRNARHPRTG